MFITDDTADKLFTGVNDMAINLFCQELLCLTERALVGAAHSEHQLKPAHLQ
jgi:hypothetical protein